jgi:hypothetical protein
VPSSFPVLSSVPFSSAASKWPLYFRTISSSRLRFPIFDIDNRCAKGCVINRCTWSVHLVGALGRCFHRCDLTLLALHGTKSQGILRSVCCNGIISTPISILYHTELQSIQLKRHCHYCQKLVCLVHRSRYNSLISQRLAAYKGQIDFYEYLF